MLLITFSEGNCRAEVEENISNGTFVCDDDAHKVILCTRSPFFCISWVLLRSKKPILKIQLTIRGKNLKDKNLLAKECEKTRSK